MCVWICVLNAVVFVCAHLLYMCMSDLPYSQRSHALYPLWEELAQALKDREDVVIARIDASANDINLSMQDSYPSLRLFPALYAERVGHTTSNDFSLNVIFRRYFSKNQVKVKYIGICILKFSDYCHTNISKK